MIEYFIFHTKKITMIKTSKPCITIRRELLNKEQVKEKKHDQNNHFHHVMHQ